MKRIGNIYGKICSMDNLLLADYLASKRKTKKPGVIAHRKNEQINLDKLQEMLISKTYRTPEYYTFKVFERKERDVYCLSFYPGQICHHAAMNVIEPIFRTYYTADTYSCVKGRGTHKASEALKRALRNVPETTYCLKLDIKKFYPSVDHDVLKTLLRRKIKDNSALWLLDELIDSADGLPIGNYPSGLFANFYLTGFDHWMKEKKGVINYLRYMDDMVILADNKPYLHQLLDDIRQYLHNNLKLTIKHNYQVFPVSEQGIDFVGYVHYHTHTLLRPGIKRSLRKAVKKGNRQSIASLMGWAKHCDSRHLVKKLMKQCSTLKTSTLQPPAARLPVKR